MLLIAYRNATKRYADAVGQFITGIKDALSRAQPPHGGLPLHVHHREDEAMYILEGEYEIQCGDEIVRVTLGVFILLPRDTPNRYQNTGDTPGKFLHITSLGNLILTSRAAEAAAIFY